MVVSVPVVSVVHRGRSKRTLSPWKPGQEYNYSIRDEPFGVDFLEDHGDRPLRSLLEVSRRRYDCGYQSVDSLCPKPFKAYTGPTGRLTTPKNGSSHLHRFLRTGVPQISGPLYIRSNHVYRLGPEIESRHGEGPV